ncbi:MAG: sugar phosphate isomerase/epimerase [Lachnospiraceae bacterium]|nr:sugar phosphate isomerase/epimerase [Lachnospiraceae bacterium]
MKIGIRMHDMKPGTIEERAAMAQENGFACAHIALAKLIKEYKVADGALTPGFAMHLKEVFAKNHVDIAVLGCYLNLATPDEDELKHNLLQYESQLRFASWLGCGVVGTETGAPNKEYRSVPECKSDAAFDILSKNLETVVGYAEKLGVVLAIEPVVRHIIHSPKRARQMLDRIGSPNLRIIFDPVNLLDKSNYQQRDEIFAESLECFGKEIAMVHLKDFVVGEQDLKACAPGTGEMNYEAILAYMKKEKPYIHATMEDTVPDNAIQAMQYLYGVYDRV